MANIQDCLKHHSSAESVSPDQRKARAWWATELDRLVVMVCWTMDRDIDSNSIDPMDSSWSYSTFQAAHEDAERFGFSEWVGKGKSFPNPIKIDHGDWYLFEAQYLDN